MDSGTVRQLITPCRELLASALLPAKLLMGQDQPFQSDGKADVTACHHVLDFEVQEAGREAQFLHHPGILPGCQS